MNAKSGCQLIISDGIYKGNLCCKLTYCIHKDQHGVINKARVTYNINHIQMNKIDLFTHIKNINTIKNYDIWIYKNKLVSKDPSLTVCIENDWDQLYYGKIDEPSLKLLLYQLIKYKK